MNKKILTFLILLKAIALIIFIVFYQLPLAPDEAQYWTWSRSLDWGYYSKPPGIAWQIWAGTALFGNNELGVRFGSIVIAALLSIIVYMLTKKIFNEDKTACWSSLAFTFSPVGIYLSLAATTDVGAILFFTLAVFVIVNDLKRELSPRYIQVGFIIACGALFKWIVFFLWGFILIGLIFQPLMRNRKFFWGLILSLTGLIPSLIWNLSHDWATFQHVGRTLFQPGNAGPQKGNFFDFLAAQIGLFSPIFFFFFCLGFFKERILFKKQNASIQFLSWIVFGIFVYILVAITKKMQPNWAIYLYPCIFCFATVYAVKKSKGQKWLLFGVCSSVVLTSITLMIPWLQQNSIGPKFSYKINPVQQNLGWQRIPDVLKELHYNPEKDFLIADKYQMTSLLSFYNPQKTNAYFLNVSQMRKNQFSYFPGLENQKGKTAYFFISENKIPSSELISYYETQYKSKLSSYFNSIECVGAYPLFENHNQPVKFALVFRCQNYNGLKPQDPNVY